MIHLALLLALQGEWLPIDPRSKGTGNAGVALADGAASGYWNPARLGLPPPEGEEFDLLGAGFALQASGPIDTAVEGEALQHIDTLAVLYATLDFQGIQSRFNAGTSTSQDLQDAMRVIGSVLEILKIRGGIFDNLASAKSSTVWTLGLGLNVAGFFLDLKF